MNPRGGPRRLFLDTGVLLATVLPRDPDHEVAVGVLHRLGDGEWTSAFTTDYVLAEAFNFLRRKVRRRATAEALVSLVFGADDFVPVVASVLRVHSGRFARALERYRREHDRGLSLTDWTSVATMQDAGIAMIATFDAAFRGVVEVVDGAR
ncbi:MAG: type II toxin-antitoxin system VapC family toxin [Methanobacteriota archaeon]